MPQTKQHKNAAQKQAAYRARKPKVPTQATLAILARKIAFVVADGAQSRHSRVPAHVVGEDTVQTLRNLICWLDTFKDDVRYPNWELFHPNGTNERDPFEND